MDLEKATLVELRQIAKEKRIKKMRNQRRTTVMKITSNIENSNYTQWITGFVESVINQADLKCNEVVIDEVDNDRIWLTIDGTEYIIRTWNFEPVTYDLQGRTCGERVDYTLFKDVSDGNGGGHGEEVCRGVEIIRWDNDEVINAERKQ